jgi:YD repeat-containing protein
LASGTGQSSRFATLLASFERVPAEIKGGISGILLCGLAAMALTVGGARRRNVPALQFARTIIASVRVQLFSLSVVGKEEVRSRTRLRAWRMPSLFWRFATVVAAVCLIGSDPAWNSLFTARAACDIPANLSSETIRITEFAYDAEGRLAQVNSPEGVINYGYDLATGRLIRTCTAKSEVAYGYDELGRLKIELDTPTITRSVPAKNDLALEQLLVLRTLSCEERSDYSTQHPNSVPTSYCCPG